MATMTRLVRIGCEVARLAVVAARDRRAGEARPPKLPQELRSTLERLGPVFVKLGQAVSVRRDLLPDVYIAALHGLQDHVAPFPPKDAIHEIEHAFGRKLKVLFSSFEHKPMAAASIAQLHRAQMPDGRVVIVKVRRPHIRADIDRDMRALKGALRILLIFVPRLRRHRPLRIVDEIRTNLQKETDFRQEARNIKKFSDAFKGWPTINVPNVVDDLYTDAVLVQEMSHGSSIDDPAIAADGPRLAQLFIDAYLHQFFEVGLFHGDPHPGNLFVMPDGRLCFHDLGLVGFLDRTTRRNLALFVQAFISQDAAWVLDTAIDLGILGGEMDRAEFVRGIEEILADYAARPLKEWSMAEAFVRVMRLGHGENFSIPYNLLVLMRAMFLIENALRTLDPEFNVLDALIARGGQTLKAVIGPEWANLAVARLKSEAALTVQDLPALIGTWLHKAARQGTSPTIAIRHEGLELLELHLDRGGNRLALALVTLGLYVAASLLMQQGIGPSLIGHMPLLAAGGYAVALWLTFRLARAISRSGHL